MHEILGGVASSRDPRLIAGATGHRLFTSMISLRVDDGRFAPVVLDVPLAPGVWRPTPPGFAPFFDPWLGQVEPLVLDSLSQSATLT
jgi:hypothetical protein